MNVRQYNILIKCVLAILLSALFASCKDEDEEYKESSSGNGCKIGFDAFQDGFQKPTTRAVIDDIADLDNLYVLSMKNNGTGWDRVFQEDVLTLTNNGYTTNGQIWDYSPTANWENGYNYKFRAYYPNTFNTSAGESCANGFQHSAISSGSTVLTLNNYRSATDPRNNSDILVSTEVARAYSTTLGNDDPVPLNMKHLLACVGFKIKSKKGKKLNITKFTINGYSKEGSCVVNQNIVWTPIWNESPKIKSGDNVNVNLTYNNGTMTENNNDFVFKDKGSNMEISPKDLYIDNSNNNYLYSWSNKYKNFYVILKSEYNTNSESLGAAVIDGTKEETESYEFENYEQLLFIPQELDRAGVNFNIKFSVKRQDWGRNDDNVKEIKDVELKHQTFAEIEFYFGDTDPGENNRSIAIVDLTANGKVKKWEAGTKYSYTIGMYEYQATANITIEDWTHHIYEEDLR